MELGFSFFLPLIILSKVLVGIPKSLHIKLRFSPHSALQIIFNLPYRDRYPRHTVGVEPFVTRLRCEIILCTCRILTSISSNMLSIVDPVCAVLSTFNLFIRYVLMIETFICRLDISIIYKFRNGTSVTSYGLHTVFDYRDCAILTWVIVGNRN